MPGAGFLPRRTLRRVGVPAAIGLGVVAGGVLGAWARSGSAELATFIEAFGAIALAYLVVEELLREAHEREESAWLPATSPSSSRRPLSVIPLCRGDLMRADARGGRSGRGPGDTAGTLARPAPEPDIRDIPAAVTDLDPLIGGEKGMVIKTENKPRR